MSEELITWNLQPLASGDHDKNLTKKRTLAEKAAADFVTKWKANTDYTVDPKVLKQSLDEYESLLRNYGINGWEWYYFQLRSAQDQLDAELKAKSRSVDEHVTKLYNQIQFFELTLAKISIEKQNEFLANSDLSGYHHFLNRLFISQKYLLSDEEEKIVNLLSQPARESWISMTSTFLSREEVEVIQEDGSTTSKPFTEAMALLNSQDKKVRDHAAIQVHNVTAKYADTATEELNAILLHKKMLDELRGFSRPDQSRHLSDDIESETVDALTAAVESKFSISQKFYELKAKLMGVKRLAYHERNVPYGNVDQPYPFSQAQTLVEAALTGLDKEFGDLFTQFISNGQFDVYPRTGKVGGAFCAHNLLTQPTYILLNHTNKLQDVLTIAHEMGHGIHNELARKNQNALNFGTSLATAEVASTFMEDFVLERLLENADDDLKLSVIIMKLNDDISSIFRQVACYRFEQQLHTNFRQKGYLPTNEIGAIFKEHMSHYMGNAIEQSEGSQNWWVYWSHIRNFFYVYSYASGLLISKYLQHLVQSDAENIQKVKSFMSAGQSSSPAEIFNHIGININQSDFWLQGLEEVESLLAEATELSIKLGKITK